MHWLENKIVQVSSLQIKNKTDYNHRWSTKFESSFSNCLINSKCATDFIKKYRVYHSYSWLRMFSTILSSKMLKY